jgi:hypothetical protein
MQTAHIAAKTTAFEAVALLNGVELLARLTDVLERIVVGII